MTCKLRILNEMLIGRSVISDAGSYAAYTKPPASYPAASYQPQVNNNKNNKLTINMQLSQFFQNSLYI